MKHSATPDSKSPYLAEYYIKYFPMTPFMKWLSCHNNEKPNQREFSFGGNHRYNSFDSGQKLQDYLRKHVPERIDLGAIYSAPLSDRNRIPEEKFFPISKEYVLDIDISDYDSIRACGCKKEAHCVRCWPLMNCAARILDQLLDKVFGLQHRLWVFSGRRGIHCWVSDEKMMKLGWNGRNAITEFLTLIKGNQTPIFSEGKIHPNFNFETEVFIIAEQCFVQLFLDEKKGMCHVFNEEKYWNTLVSKINEQKLKKEVLEFLQKMKTSPSAQQIPSKKKWGFFKELFKNKGISQAILELVYSFVYPRLDVNVSKQMNHLLKAPFSVHPNTNLMCVPFDVQEEFSPNDCPDLIGLIEKKYETTFKKHVDLFEKHVGNLSMK
jgi:DNA primase small subunit